MEAVMDGVKRALILLFTLDKEVYQITLFTLKVTGTATLISVVLSLPLAFLIALKDFPGKRLIISLANLGMGLPPTVVGLWVSLMLWRSGPFGRLRLIYTPKAMIIAQAVIAAPVILALSTAALQQLDKKLRWQIMALGATPIQMLFLMIREARYSLLAAVMAGFGAAVSEVGASMMVGGNIAGYTRVLTTAIVLETGKGNFDEALALSFILLLVSYLGTLWLTLLQQRRHKDVYN
ncbi:ABC transporter permease [Thermosediminibacter oceani]|uniref:Binding-protein-dependent transport systems inner membrane component n=1 Tax=Thermosediminibacter oceani (strain ATCC BAA-1034 / DSM 16646 / JW/IW-1228P) TaxID=555079 RepID=D9S054_THEOJ|nr:ABC transporter permease [Thermosediminibacter oceani]ADL06982.1 binding-protein-dependent transport systems inner membrane component [Thermosediminibacter oceani DSM 16646]